MARANAIFEDETLHNTADFYLEFTELKMKVREEDKISISLNKSPTFHELSLQTHFMVQPGFKCDSGLGYLSAANWLTRTNTKN